MNPNANRPILLIEDNPMDVDLTRRTFRHSGTTHPLIVARDGEEALAWLARWEAGEPAPVLILLDLNLPRVNGLEVLRQIKSHPRFRVIPVVALTTSMHNTDLQAAYQLGVNSYVIKPVDFEAFLPMAQLLEHYWTNVNQPLEP
jgi:CheY-like chemotaxis protein